MKKTKKEVISITLLGLILLTMLIPSISLAAEGGITIKDAKLKEAIVTQNEVDINNDGIITEEEMKNVKRIQIPEDVTDLTGLEYATNLEEITIKYSEKMPDLSKVNSKSEDIGINIDVSEATTTVKLDFLKNLKKLSYVMIYKPDTDNPINIDYSALSQIKTLNSLSLRYGVAPKSIKELGNLNYLLRLEIAGNIGNDNETIDLSGIEDFTNLTSLTIVDYNLQNVSKVGQLANLADLTFCDVKGISELSALANCNELQYVEIRSTDLADVSFLENKRNIWGLHLTNSPIKNIKEQKDLILLVATLPSLDVLSLDFEGIKIENMEQFKQIRDFLSADETNNENVNIENSEKTKIEDNKETKTEKPTRIPQAGSNIVTYVSLVGIVMIVAMLAVLFVKAKRK